MMGWNNTASWGAGHWLAMILMMVIFLGLLIAAMLWVARIARSDPNDRARTNMPIQVADDALAQRFARGEIDKDEFQRPPRPAPHRYHPLMMSSRDALRRR